MVNWPCPVPVNNCVCPACPACQQCANGPASPPTPWIEHGIKWVTLLAVLGGLWYNHRKDRREVVAAAEAKEKEKLSALKEELAKEAEDLKKRGEDLARREADFTDKEAAAAVAAGPPKTGGRNFS